MLHNCRQCAGVKLDGAQFTNPDANSDPAKARWIIWFNANGVIYEQVQPPRASLGEGMLSQQ